MAVPEGGLSSHPASGPGLAFGGIPTQPLGVKRLVCAALVLLVAMLRASGQPVISEILFNPPGADLPYEYIELRGEPYQTLGAGSYFVVLEGDAGGNPGVVQNVFNLSGRQLGANGFLLLLQKTNDYAYSPACAVLVNTDSGEGFGSGSSSSIRHEGESNQVDLENGSATYLLIQTDMPPETDDDLDTDNDGTIDVDTLASWTVLDSVGVLDNDGAGDMAYGAINFRRHLAAQAAGTTVDIGFTPDYVGRSGNTTGSSPAAWLTSGSLEGNAPEFELGDPTDTEPPEFTGRALDHLGRSNFGDAEPATVLLLPGDAPTAAAEAGESGVYTIGLNTEPAGMVSVELTADDQLRFSVDGGATFTNLAVLTFATAEPRVVTVRAVDDSAIEPHPHLGAISHELIASEDEAYPTSMPIPPRLVQVGENDFALLNELKVNPPGPEEVPFEFIEIRGPPDARMDRVYVVALEGDEGADPGRANVVVDLTGAVLGGNGLLLLAATNHPYAPATATTVFQPPQFNAPGGALDNGTITFFLVSSPTPIVEGEDLDKGDNGILEEMPNGAYVMDEVAWKDGNNDDLVFGQVELVQPAGTPDAATRFPWDDRPRTAAAWFNGNLFGTNGAAVVYDPSRSSTNFAPGSALTPGAGNQSAPFIAPLAAFSSAIGDPTTRLLYFTVEDPELNAGDLTVSVRSDNPNVVADSNLVVVAVPTGGYSLAIQPHGIGYATITIAADNGVLPGHRSFPYAASAAGLISSRFHTGSTDASAAIPVPPDLMLVGDDESQVLRLYRRYESNDPVNGFEVGPLLDLPDFESSRPREVDIEGAARAGDRIYWLGSHSHADIGEIRTNRARVFATDVTENGEQTALVYAGHYEHLKADLVAWDAFNVHGLGADHFGLAASATEGVLPKDFSGAGFNMEGLAMAPGSTSTAWLCFRAPIVPAAQRLYTLIVPVLNFDSLAIGDALPGNAVFGTPIQLDLQGRGIRSIEGDTNGYLLIAGPAGNIPTPNPPHDFKVYTWSGLPEDPPQQHAADLTGLNPEAIVELPPRPWTETSTFQILSDNGREDYYRDGMQAKFLPEPNFKKFRSDIITLGPVVVPEPFLISIARQETEVTLTWRAQTGRRYGVRFKDELTGESWTDTGVDVLAEEPLVTANVPMTEQRQRFYQVVVLP